MAGESRPGSTETAAAGQVQSMIDLATPDGLPYRLRRGRHGWFLYNANDVFVGRSLDAYGEYSPQERDCLLRLTPPGGVVVDAGANIGALTIPLARHVGDHGFVHAFEPERLLHQLLATNVALNALLNVSAVRAGLGAVAERGLLSVADHRRRADYGHTQLRKQGSGVPVDIRTIDSLDLAQCHLIKIDVEGMEREVLEGATSTIERCKPVLYLDSNPGPNLSPMITRLLAFGYKLWWHPAPLFREDNYLKNPTDVFGGFGSLNILGMPRSSSTQVVGLVEISGPDAPLPPGVTGSLQD